MASDKKPVTLSAVDFLGLTEIINTKLVDLSQVGYRGAVWVKGLNYEEKQAVLSISKKGKARIYSDQSMDVSLSDMPADAGPKFLRAALVTDETGKHLLFDEMKKELGATHLVMEKLKQMPNPVINLIVKEVRTLSGMDEDAPNDDDDPKKD